jgi:hypothetical protein
MNYGSAPALKGAYRAARQNAWKQRAVKRALLERRASHADR